MAEMENITFLLKINSTEEKDFKTFLSNIFGDINPHIEYNCSCFWDDEYYIDAIDFAVDIDQRLLFDAYGENELTFGFFDKILENTECDCLLENQGYIIFIRRNGVVMAINSFDCYPDCTFINCDKLLKTEHITGYQNEYNMEIKFSEGIDNLKKQMYDIIAGLSGNADSVKLIEHDMRYGEFAVDCDYFGISVYEEDCTNEKNVYTIWIHLIYCKETFDLNYNFLKKYISVILEKYEFSEKYKEKTKGYNGNDIDYLTEKYLKWF